MWGRERRALAHIQPQPGDRHDSRNDATTAVLSFDPNANGSVREIAVSALQTFPFTVTVYAGGFFSTMGGQAGPRLAAVDGGSGAVTSWNPGANSAVWALALTLGDHFGRNRMLYVGGEFTSCGGQARNRLAAVDEAGVLTEWNPDASGRIRSLAFGPGTIFVGGNFSTVGGQVRSLRHGDGRGGGTVRDAGTLRARRAKPIRRRDGSARFAPRTGRRGRHSL